MADWLKGRRRRLAERLDGAQTVRTSIVTISYNQARHLGAAIDSVGGQSGSLEYIVVDAGSTDDTGIVLRKYSHQIDTTIVEPDRGPADGLNKGFSRATGDIYGYVNADDILLPGAVQSVVRWFTSYPDIDVIYGNGLVLDDIGRPVRRYTSSRFDPITMLVDGLSVMQQATFFRARAFESCGGFNVDNRSCWDTELLLAMHRAGSRFMKVPDGLGGFRIYSGSITGSGRMEEDIRRQLDRIAREMYGLSTPFPLSRRLAHRVLRYVRNPGILARRIWEGPLIATMDRELSLRRLLGQPQRGAGRESA